MTQRKMVASRLSKSARPPHERPRESLLLRLNLAVTMMAAVALVALGIAAAALNDRNEAREVIALQQLIIQSASSDDPIERRWALQLAQDHLPPEVASKLAEFQAKSDADPAVRTAAGQQLSHTDPSAVDGRGTAVASLQPDEELRDKGLLPGLRDADGYVASNNRSGQQKALEIYRNVTSQLTRRTRRDLKLLSQAERQLAVGDIEEATHTYRAAFHPLIAPEH